MMNLTSKVITGTVDVAEMSAPINLGVFARSCIKELPSFCLTLIKKTESIIRDATSRSRQLRPSKNVNRIYLTRLGAGNP